MSAPTGTPSPSPGSAPLARWERAGLTAFAVLVVAFGVVTEIRSAFQSTSKTDFGVYARAAWAARTGADVYIPTDNNGWHYHYPPTFAVLMIPLADPYPFLGRGGYLPFSVSVAVWYAFSAWCVWYTVHALAGAVVPGAVRGSRRWWSARLVPLFVCVGAVGLTLGRGQVNVLLVALVAGAFAATARGRRAASGVWLAAAVVLKLIPGLLLLFPLVRRDWRALAGAAAGGVVLAVGIPAVVWGLPRSVELNLKPIELVLRPAVSQGGDRTREAELTGAKATDNQSVRAAVEAWMYPDRETRPDTPDPVATRVHWAVAAVLVLVSGAVGLRRLTADPADQLVFLGCLCAVMLVVTPVSHMHYYAVCLPLAAGLWLRGLAARPAEAVADRRTTLWLAAWGLMTAVPLFPGPVFERLRECGFGTAATVALWAYGLSTLGRSPAAAAAAEPAPPARLAA